MFDDKAQLHTLEGVTAATIMILILVYAIDATSLTPLTSSTANIHVESELMSLGQDILGFLDYTEPGFNSKLKNDISTWSGREYDWNGVNYTEPGQIQNNLTNNITTTLNATLTGQGIAHNVIITYLSLDSTNNTVFSSSKMIYNGEPSNNAVIVSRKIALHDDDINQTKYFDNPIKDIDPASNLWNLVDVKLVLWRM